MKRLLIEKTDSTPEINFNYPENNFVIKGISMPEDAIGFYQSTRNWLSEYSKKSIPDATFHFQLDYFNSATSKMILEIMLQIKSIGNSNRVLWYYEEDDEDLMEAGQEYQLILGGDILELVSVEV